MMNLIERNMEQIIALCEKHKVLQLYVFGSVLTNRSNINDLPKLKEEVAAMLQAEDEGTAGQPGRQDRL